jgi:TonB family protein
MILLLLEASVRSLALALAVWLAMLALRPRNPHVHKTVWLTVLLASVAMPFVLQWRVAPSFDVPESLVTLTAFGNAPSALTATGSGAFPMNTVTGLYAVITAALLARFALGLARISRIRRKATPLGGKLAEGADVRVSANLLSPATFGSTILLPAGVSEWSESKLAAVLSHERAHVRHKDCYVQWLARLHACIFWFNPLAWWLHRRLAELAETTSDDAVIEATADRAAYADLLLEIARNPPAGRVVMSAARPNISERIERIISNIPPSSPPRHWVRVLSVVVVFPLFALAAATVNLAQEPNAMTNANTPAGPNPQDDPLAPKVIDFGDLANLEQYYPPQAKRQGIEGIVTVALKIDEQGNVVDARSIDEMPANPEWGFAEAAARVALTIRFSNPRGVPATRNIKVKFALRGDHAGAIKQQTVPAPGAGTPSTDTP